MVLGWSSPAQLPVMVGDVFNFPVTSADFQWVSSIPTLGAACACMPAGFLVDLVGRKYTMLAMAIPFVVGKHPKIGHSQLQDKK
jgi:MFS family permease